jgi:hypothetical protein
MDKIVCYIDSMSLTQKAVSPDGVEHNVPSDCFAESMVGMCTKYNANKIHFFGNKYFIEGVIEEVSAKEMETYSTKNIEFEVN